MDQYIQVLLIEQEPDTISVISLSLSEIKECKLEVCSSGEEALLKMPELKPDLILITYGLLGRNTLDVMNEMIHKAPSLYVIVSLPETDSNLADSFLIAGAKECLIEDKNYVPNLVAAVKKALISIAERDSFELPQMTRADQFAMDENLPDAVFSLDLDGKILYANRAISPLLGFEQKDIVGVPFSELIVDHETRKGFEKYISVVENEVNFSGLVSLKNSLGLGEDFNVNFTLMEGETVYGVAHKLRIEAEEHEELEEEEQESAIELVDHDVIPARLGPYRVITLLGAGSMGRVYEGIDEQLDRPVAIKVLNRALASDRTNLERFRQEAKILASITHPNIALIYYFGNLEEIPFFCMEYLPGGSLETLLEQRGVLDPETALAYTMQVGLGLGEALEKGVIHLDIKPSNLMIAENDRIKIVDFGLARSGREKEETSGTVVGTPLYIAPEQIQGGVVDYRCDIYSLGITFFQMVYGFLPHSALTLPEIFKKRLYEELPRREELNTNVPVVIYEIITRMTARDPAKRYGNYSEIINDLERARRSEEREQIPVELSRPPESAVRMQGELYDRPFAEILGEVARKRLSGKLTLSWIDLYKNVHFRDGKITAVLSNQEGESFLDLLIVQKLLTGKQARSIASGSTNLFLRYSAAMQDVPPEMRSPLSQDMQLLAWKILEGLFSWVVGEFILEEGEFPDQLSALEIGEVIRRGVMDWMDSGSIRRRMLDGHCKLTTTAGFQKLLRDVDIPATHRLLAFRIGDGILCKDLQIIAGMDEEELLKALYLFRCLGVIKILELRPEDMIEKAVPQIPVSPEPVGASPTNKRRVGFSSPTPQLARTPKTDLGSYYFQCAFKSYSNKNHWAAVEYCKKALEHKKDSRIYQLMGRALATHPAFKHEALEAYKEALNLDPVNITVERDIADLYFFIGSYALAKSKYESYLKNEPDDEYSKKRLQEIRKRKQY